MAGIPEGDGIIAMADRYQDRPFPTEDDYDSGDQQSANGRSESDPLAELARLIGQTDPFAMGRANHQVVSRGVERERYQPPAPADDEGVCHGPAAMDAAGEPAAQPIPPQPIPPQEAPSAVHPLRRYATPVAEPEPEYHQPELFEEPDHAADPSRYDEALYGQLETGEEETQQDQAYPDDPYAYEDGYGERTEDPVRKRGGGTMTVVMVLALAIVGTGGAYAYRTYVGSSRGGDVPVIKADTNPIKIVPAAGDGAKVPDRMAANDSAEKIVPREEAPLDVNAKAATRVVLAPLNPNPNPPPLVNVIPAAPPLPTPGTLPNGEPHKVKTLSVHGDQPEATAASVAPPAATKPTLPRASAPPATSRNNQMAPGNAPLSLSPQAVQPPSAEARTHVANTAPVSITPAGGAAATGGGYLVQVSSQRNEADAQASYRALQGKFPGVLGSRGPVIKRADLGEKGVYYRAMVGPFGSTEEAAQFCGTLKTAGGQCVVQRK